MKMNRITVVTLGGMVGMLGAITVATRDIVAAEQPKVAVCHFDDDGIPSEPKTLMVGNQNAADKHVANHTILNGHEGDDFLGDCIQRR